MGHFHQHALYGFTPKGRPVYWRFLICLARIYQAALGNTTFDDDAGRPDEVEKVFLPANNDTFPYNFQPDEAHLFEPYRLTLQATTQYIDSLILPKVQQYLELQNA